MEQLLFLGRDLRMLEKYSKWIFGGCLFEKKKKKKRNFIFETGRA
jgi:hypothetical protein